MAVRFEGNEPPAKVIELAVEAEKSGASSIWITQHLLRRDPVVLAAQVLAATSRIRVGIQNLTPFINHPLTMAMTLSTLSEAGEGRVAASLGIGNALDLSKAGIVVADGPGMLERSLLAVTALVAGQTTSWEAPLIPITECRLDHPPAARPAIYASVLSPAQVAIARRTSAGIQLSAGLSLPYVKSCLAGLDEAVPVTAFTYLCSGSQQARQSVRRRLAYLFRNDLLADNVEGAGLSIERARIRDAVAVGDLDLAQSLIPEAAVEFFALPGGANAIDTLRALARVGVHEVAIDLGADADDVRSGIDLIRLARP